MSTYEPSAVSLMSLYKVGAHRGNRKTRLNPRLKNRIYGFKQDLCLIDLAKTQDSLVAAQKLLYTLGSRKKQVLIVGTSKYARMSVPKYAAAFSTGPMPYVNSRWLGGTVTNWQTIKKTLKTLEKLKKIIENEEFFNKLSKNERLNVVRRHEKISKFFAGLSYLKSNCPGAVIVLNASDDPIAIQEADVSGIPVIALSNTSTLSLPKDLSYTIIMNNHSIKAVDLVAEQLIEAYNKGSENQVTSEVTQAKPEETKVTA